MEIRDINLDVWWVIPSDTTLGGRFDGVNFSCKHEFVYVHEHKSVVRTNMFVKWVITAELDVWQDGGADEHVVYSAMPSNIGGNLMGETMSELNGVDKVVVDEHLFQS